MVVHPDATSLLASLERGRVDAVVVDPTIVRDAAWVRLRAALADPGLPVLLYSPLTAVTAGRIVAASGAGVHEVLLTGVDDDPDAIRRRLHGLRRPQPPRRVLARLSGRIAMLPPPLQRGSVALFCEAPIPRRADALASAESVPRRTVDRWMGRVGLAATATLLDVARLSRIWVPLVEDGLTPAKVAHRCGYSGARALAVHTHRLVGVPPAHLGRGVSVEEFVDRLSQRAQRG